MARHKSEARVSLAVIPLEGKRQRSPGGPECWRGGRGGHKTGNRAQKG
jgi:hypothetical protein